MEAQRLARMEVKEGEENRRNRRGKKRGFGGDNDTEETYAAGDGYLKNFKAGKGMKKKRRK